MAGKFFNQRVKGANRSFIAYIIVGVVVLCIFIIVILMVSLKNKKNDKNAVIEIRDVVTIEINSELPDKTLFFSELQNVKEDDIIISYDDVDLAKVGEYTVNIEVNKTNYLSTLAVVDTQVPEVTTKDLIIEKGESYAASDFVEKCSDNSDSGCIISFYEMGKDQDGNLIDYSKYTEEGKYTIQIVASDMSGNNTSPLTVNLTIGDGTIEPPGPTYCKYGNSEYDTNAYILGVNISQNGCALDLNLYYDENTSAPAYELAKKDTEKLQKEISKLNIDKDIKKVLNQVITPVLNTSGTGVVGYTVHLELSMTYEDGSSEVVASYYINLNGDRVYSINKYNLS